MDDKTLRKELTKLAHENPELRKHLVPLLKEAAAVPVMDPMLGSHKLSPMFFQQLKRSGPKTRSVELVEELLKDTVWTMLGTAIADDEIDMVATRFAKALIQLAGKKERVIESIIRARQTNVSSDLPVDDPWGYETESGTSGFAY
jgi:hypothetical protein